MSTGDEAKIVTQAGDPAVNGNDMSAQGGRSSPPEAFATTLPGDGSTSMVPPLTGADTDLLSPAGTLQIAASLILVLVLIVALGWLSRQLPRLTQHRGKRALRVVDMLALGARERVVLVEVEGSRLVLGLAPGRVQTLHVIPAADSRPTDAAVPLETDAAASAPHPLGVKETDDTTGKGVFASVLRSQQS